MSDEFRRKQSNYTASVITWPPLNISPASVFFFYIYYLSIIPLIWLSFSICCCLSLLSLFSSRLWYCSRILLVCCSWVNSLLSYSSSLRCDIIRRSFRELISSSYSRTCVQRREEDSRHVIRADVTLILMASLRQ